MLNLPFNPCQAEYLYVLHSSPLLILYRGQKYFNIALVLQDEGLILHILMYGECVCRTSEYCNLQFSLVLQTHSPYIKRICNKEHKGVICNMTSSSNSSQSTRPTGENYSSFLDFTRNYQGTSGIFVPCCKPAAIMNDD